MLQHFWDMFGLYSIHHRTKVFGGEQGYSKLYGALDAFHDTELGLFELSGTKNKIPLLSCVGFLQALVTQQNIVISLGHIFNLQFDFRQDPVLSRHRLLRNRIAGHPHQSDGKVSSFFPSNSRGKDWFEVVFYGDEDEKSIVIRVDDFILEHRNSLKIYVEKISLAAEEVEFGMFQNLPFETRQNGQLVERGEMRWRSFKSFTNENISPREFSITTFSPSPE